MRPEAEQFSEQLFAYQRGKDEFEDGLAALGFEAFESIGGDYYDSSIEFYGVAGDARLTDEQQKFIHSHGFWTAYLNHKDRYETHYFWRDKEFKPYAGSRTLYPHKKRRVAEACSVSIDGLHNWNQVGDGVDPLATSSAKG